MRGNYGRCSTLFDKYHFQICIKLIANQIEKDDQTNLVQWLFPQAYYSVATVYHAYLRVVDQISNDHTGLINNYSRFLVDRKILCLGYYAEGPNGEIRAPRLSQLKPNSNYQYLNTPQDIDGHIGSFLTSTNEGRLKERAEEIREKEKISRLSPRRHIEIGKVGGYTTIIHLLYRKRIKSNYKDIDIYLYPALDVNFFSSA